MDNRFSWLFENDRIAGRPLWDRVVIADGLAKTIPSKGSIVPGWVLTFAARNTVNLKALTSEERLAVLEQAGRAAHTVAKFGTHVFQFEHGPSEVGSVLGCGLDIAHLHTVPLSFDLIEAVRSRSRDVVDWREASSEADPWAHLPEGEYVIVREVGTCRTIVGAVRVPTSQLVRRIIAAEMAEPDKWDYRTHAGHQNVEATVSAFKADDHRTH